MIRRWLLPVAVAVAVVAATVSTGTAGSTSPVGKAPPYTTFEETFVDTTRPSEPSGGAAEPSRTLVTTIYRPGGKGPFPLIMFSHGLTGHPDKFTRLFGVWAEAGYVVAAPAFPLTSDRATDPLGNIADVAQQPGDISFVLSEVLGMDGQRGSPLFKAIDEDRIGAAGLSLGGNTTYGVVFNDCCLDERIIAAEVLNGLLLAVGDGDAEYELDGHVPLLIAHSDTDPLLSYSIAQNAFTAAEPPVWLVTFYGAGHSAQWEDTPTGYDDIAEQVTLEFWDATLRGKKKAFDRLERHATVEGVSSIEVKR